MRMSGRVMIGGAIAAFGLAASGASFSDAIDLKLTGAWTTSEADCSKVFVRRGGALAYREPVDRFAQAAIIEPGVLRMPSSTCRVQSVLHEKEGVKITADCRDSISYTTQTAVIKVRSPGEIVYSPTGDPALDTSLIKCKL